MKIAIIGAGNVGSTLARALVNKGHDIYIGVKDPSKAHVQELANEHDKISAHDATTAAQVADAIIVATPPTVAADLADDFGDIKDKVLIDATNSVFSKPESYSNAFEAFKALSNCDNIVKCFNTTGYENMANPVYNGKGIDMWVAGDSEKGKALATQLAKEIGFGTVHDFGGDEQAPLLEQLAMVWINMAILQKGGRDMAIQVVRR